MQVHTFVKTLLFNCSVSQIFLINIFISNLLFSLTSVPTKKPVEIFSSAFRFLLEGALMSVYGLSLAGTSSVFRDCTFSGKQYGYIYLLYTGVSQSKQILCLIKVEGEFQGET